MLGIAVDTFSTLGDLLILDLTRLPPPSRFFEAQTKTSIGKSLCIQLEQLRPEHGGESRTGDREHIDYVPMRQLSWTAILRRNRRSQRPSEAGAVTGF